MATLPNLLPDSTGTVSGVTDQAGATTGLHTAVTDASDTTYLTSGIDSGGTVLLGLSNTPNDFLSMDTLDYSIRLRLNGTVTDDTMTFSATVYAGNGTSTPLTNTVQVATQATAGSTFNLKTGAFTIQGTPSKEQWDTAHLHLSWTYSKAKASDGLSIRVSEAAVTGTYTAMGPATDLTGLSDLAHAHSADSITVTEGPPPPANPPYVDAVLADSPLAYWRLEETSGTVSTDETGNGNALDWVNNPTLGVTGKVDLAADLRGNTGYASTTVANDPIGAAERTYETWVYATDNAADSVVFQHGADGTNGGRILMLVRTGTGNVSLSWWGGNADYGTLTFDAWHHIAVVVPAGATSTADIIVYIDGVAQTQVVAGGSNVTLNTQAGEWRVGASVTLNYGNVMIDEPALYATALTQTRIQAHIDAANSITLDLSDLAHAHSMDSVTITEDAASGDTLAGLADLTHGHTADSIVLTQDHSLTVGDTDHAHSTESVALSQMHSLAPADTAHGHTTEGVVLSQEHSLTAADTAHGHTTDAVTLSQVHSVSVSEMAHGHTTDGVSLTQAHALAPNDTAHSHTVDSVTLSIIAELGVDDMGHAHTVESVTLTQAHSLTTQDADHAHTAESITLSVEGDLAIEDARHGHTTESVTLTQAHGLAIDDAGHQHTIDSVNLSASGDLAVSDTSHEHTLKSVVLTQVHSLAVEDMAHSTSTDDVVLAVTGDLTIDDMQVQHSADGPLALDQLHVLLLTKMVQAHSIDSVTLTEDGPLVTTGEQVYVIAEDLRTYTVVQGLRNLTIPPEHRLKTVHPEDRIIVSGPEQESP